MEFADNMDEQDHPCIECTCDQKSLQTLYDQGNFVKCMERLTMCPNTKAVEHNRLVVQCQVTRNADQLLAHLKCKDNLTVNQQVLRDYNRALALCKYKLKFDQAIKILEDRMTDLTEPFGMIDEKLTYKLFYLLAVIYIERKCNLQKAMNLLQMINDKCDPAHLPANLQYMKVKCYLAMGNIKKVKKKLRFLSPQESSMVRVYIELIKNAPIKAFRMFKEIVNYVEPLEIQYVNNESVLRICSAEFIPLFQTIRPSLRLTPEAKYNDAYMHLYTRNIQEALFSFQEVAPHFKTNPRLWLRLAECFVQVWLSNVRLKQALTQSSCVVAAQVGENMNRKVLINCESIESKVSNQPLLSARGCCLNSIMLLNKDESQLSFYPSNIMSENEMKSFRVSLHLLLTYIYLKLQDYFMARRTAVALLTTMNPTGIQKVLAILYLSESLIRLQCRRTNGVLVEITEHYREALRILQTEHKLIQQSPEYFYNCKEKLIDWNTDRLQFILKYNNAVLLALQSKLNEADHEVQQLRKEYSKNFPNDYQLPSQLVLLDAFLSRKINRKINLDCSISI